VLAPVLAAAFVPGSRPDVRTFIISHVICVLPINYYFRAKTVGTVSKRVPMRPLEWAFAALVVPLPRLGLHWGLEDWVLKYSNALHAKWSHVRIVCQDWRYCPVELVPCIPIPTRSVVVWALLQCRHEVLVPPSRHRGQRLKISRAEIRLALWKPATEEALM